MSELICRACKELPHPHSHSPGKEEGSDWEGGGGGGVQGDEEGLAHSSQLLPHPPQCHWWELPQVSFFHSKSMLVATKLLLQQTHVCYAKCCSKSFVTTNLILSPFFFFFFLSWQAYFCHKKRCVLLRQTCLSQQRRVCRDKSFVVTKLRLVATPANDITELLWLHVHTIEKERNAAVQFYCVSLWKHHKYCNSAASPGVFFTAL